jgi:hypothetical protein
MPWFPVVLLLVATSAASATWTLVCNDGNPQAVVRTPGVVQPIDWTTCDTHTDGVCTFTVERTGCLCAPRGCCGSDTFVVPVRRSRLVEQSFRPNLRLRCRRCPVRPESPAATCPEAPPS